MGCILEFISNLCSYKKKKIFYKIVARLLTDKKRELPLRKNDHVPYVNETWYFNEIYVALDLVETWA